MHFALHTVKANCTPNAVHIARMKEKYLPDYAKRLIQAREKAGFETAKAATEYHGWKYDTYIQHERGERGIKKVAASYARAFHVSEAWLLTGEGSGGVNAVPLVGQVGAGAEVQMDHEDLGSSLGYVELPFNVPEELVGLIVVGDSMRPRYDAGDVILVYRDQRSPVEVYLGEEAAVRISDGRRYLKRIIRGYQAGLYNLESWNATTIENVAIEWIGEIYLAVRAGQIRRIARNQQQASARRAKVRTMAGTKELDFGS